MGEKTIEMVCAADIPIRAYERFSVYSNPDGTFHIIVVSGDGGYIFADKFNSIEEAKWTCGLLNAAIGNAGLDVEEIEGNAEYEKLRQEQLKAQQLDAWELKRRERRGY